MTCLSVIGDNCGRYLVLVILTCALQQEFSAVSGAPQSGNLERAQPLAGEVVREAVSGRRDNLDEQKTADLTLLINETLKINNKPTGDSPAPSTNERPNFRDDWTFDRVEYDLMDFLQELNARYRYANKTQPLDLEATLIQRQDWPTGKEDLKQATASPALAASALPESNLETVTKSTIEAVKKELDAVAPGNLPSSTPPSSPPATPSAAISSVLPVSLASGDHDISESSWQYGIFDRFTRPRSSTTTTQSPDSFSMSGSSAHSDMKSFNNDECGLRSYRVEPDYYPVSAADTDEISKELSQRRQRPPLGSFFSSHKKFHQTVATSLDSSPESSASDDLLRDRPLDSLPPFDQNGEPTGGGPPSSAAASEQTDQQRAQVQADADRHAPSEDDRPSSGPDSEFNLSLRRQWLQQQLDSTLKILGFNSSQNALGEYFNRTGPLRENMMKISAAAASRFSKLGKSITGSSGGAGGGSGGSGDPQDGSKATFELPPEELGARQDELKLEARVIGGNDARLGDSPWSASLQALVSRPGTGGVEYRHYCGGTIVSEWYILTAAHCLDFMVGRESRLFVVIGDLNWRMSAASVHGRRFGVEKLIIHGGYKSTAFGHDIGLIKTKESMKPLKVNGRYIINSVCLPERNVEHTGEAELVGWGLFSNRNEMADSLQIADVPILPRPLCVDLYRRRTGLIQWLIGVELITEKQICAGTFGRGICQGDSGSALVFNENVSSSVSSSTNDKPASTGTGVTRVRNNSSKSQQQRATIIGTVAFGGIRRCSYQSLPGVYMQTSKYLDWILPRIQS